MSPTRTRRALSALPVIALATLAATASESVSASTPPTVPTGSAPMDATSGGSLPPGYVRIVDDTGNITVVVPETWSDVETAPVTNESDGSAQPMIAAAPDIEQYQTTFDVAGVRYTAIPFTADPEAVITRAGLEAGCETVEVEPYEDAVFTGSVQVGTNCGPGGGVWNMIVASPADESFTAVVQVQTASDADQEAFDIVLASFTYAGDPTVSDGDLTGTGTGTPAGGGSAVETTLG